MQLIVLKLIWISIIIGESMAKDLNEEILSVLSESVDNQELRSFIEDLLKFEAELSEVKSNRFADDYDEMISEYASKVIL